MTWIALISAWLTLNIIICVRAWTKPRQHPPRKLPDRGNVVSFKRGDA